MVDVFLIRSKFYKGRINPFRVDSKQSYDKFIKFGWL